MATPSSCFAILALTILLAGCGPSDYCRKLGRPLADTELILTALATQAPRLGISSSAKSVEDFYDAHPNCCKVFRGKEIFVQAYYEIDASYLQKHSIKSQFYEHHFEMDACGKVINIFGMGINKGERACWAREEKLSKLSDAELVPIAIAVASRQIGISRTEEAINTFIRHNPTCCEVKRNVQDPLHQKLHNKAQIDIYYPSQENRTQEGLNHILVSLDSCAEFAHMYGPRYIKERLPFDSSARHAK